MRYISLCASSEDVTSEVASILAKFVGNSPNTATRKYTIGFCIINHELCLIYDFYTISIFLHNSTFGYFYVFTNTLLLKVALEIKKEWPLGFKYTCLLNMFVHFVN